MSMDRSQKYRLREAQSAAQALSRRCAESVTERVIRQYRELHDGFFEVRGFIGPDRYHEFRFENLEKDPLGEMRKHYDGLALPEFARVEPALRTCFDSQSGYR